MSECAWNFEGKLKSCKDFFLASSEKWQFFSVTQFYALLVKIPIHISYQTWDVLVICFINVKVNHGSAQFCNSSDWETEIQRSAFV